MIRIIIAGIALFIGSWLAFDGTRALVAGDYTTAKSGPYAGRLGPWSKVVSAMGMDPRSGLIKWLHIGLGMFWLVSLVAFALKPTLGWWTLLASSVCSVWYLPLGTVLSLAELCLLFLPQIRNLR